MNELDHLVDVHRRETERAESAMAVLAVAILAIAYGVYRVAGWLL